MSSPEDRLITLFRKTPPSSGHRLRFDVDDTADRFRRMAKPDRVLVFRLLVARWYCAYGAISFDHNELSSIIDNEFAAYGDRSRHRALRIWVCDEEERG